MSKIGRKPIPIPAGVSVSVENGVVKVKGPLGELSQKLLPPISVRVEQDAAYVEAPSGEKQHRAFHGLMRSLVANMVQGVSSGYRKVLRVVGTGYSAKADGKKLTLRVGYSHPVVVEPPEGITLETPDPTTIVVKGIDKQLVGEIAARIRRVRPPEPYKGKGIRYEDEHVRRKAGKTFVATG